MSLTLNKVVKTVLCVLMCACLCANLCACNKNTKNIKEIDQISVGGCYEQTVSYTIANEDFINKLTQMYNDLKYVESDATISMSTDNSIYNLTFYSGSEVIAKLVINSENNVQFGPGTQVYSVVSGIDHSTVDTLVNDYLETSGLKTEE